MGSCYQIFTANAAKIHLACGTTLLPFGWALVDRSCHLTSLMLPYLKIVFHVGPCCCSLCSVMQTHGITILCTMVWLWKGASSSRRHQGAEQMCISALPTFSCLPNGLAAAQKSGARDWS